MTIVDIEVAMVRLSELRLVGNGGQNLALIGIYTDESITGVGEITPIRSSHSYLV
jgi:L-alanine-DL-glutamate epimerase-like enolase superfamily enzyme